MNNKRAPKQDRGIETKKRISNAGFDLFSKKGLHGTSSREIASEAGVAIGTFYSYYKDKRELFIELLKVHRSDVISILERFSPQTATEKEAPLLLIRNLIKSIWTSHHSYHQFDQKAEVLRSIDAEIDGVLKHQEEEVLKLAISLFKSRKPLLRKKNIEVASMVVFLTIREVVHSAPQHASKDDIDQMIDELADMVSRYIFK